jgi:hypothetical protein
VVDPVGEPDMLWGIAIYQHVPRGTVIISILVVVRLFHVEQDGLSDAYLPIQNFPKISPSKSSGVNSPVMPLRAS